jgi:DNA-binding MarR family transcriptional regulator
VPAELQDWSLGRLLSTAARLVERDWNHWLARHDLTHAGFLALHTLGSKALTQRQLAAGSQIEEQTMSRVVDRLERTGHVTRHRDPGDRRRRLVQRTERGHRTYEAVRRSGISDRLVEESLDDPDRFRAELGRLIARIGAPDDHDQDHDHDEER